MTDPTGPATQVTDIVVSGRRIRFEYQYPGWIEPPQITPPGMDDQIGPVGPGDPPPPCLSTEGMTDQQKLQALLRFAAAVALEKIKQQPNQNREWGLAFF